jgi:hypothetical protein
VVRPGQPGRKGHVTLIAYPFWGGPLPSEANSSTAATATLRKPRRRAQGPARSDSGQASSRALAAAYESARRRVKSSVIDRTGSLRGSRHLTAARLRFDPCRRRPSPEPRDRREGPVDVHRRRTSRTNGAGTNQPEPLSRNDRFRIDSPIGLSGTGCRNPLSEPTLSDGQPC